MTSTRLFFCVLALIFVSETSADQEREGKQMPLRIGTGLGITYGGLGVSAAIKTSHKSELVLAPGYFSNIGMGYRPIEKFRSLRTGVWYGCNHILAGDSFLYGPDQCAPGVSLSFGKVPDFGTQGLSLEVLYLAKRFNEGEISKDYYDARGRWKVSIGMQVSTNLDLRPLINNFKAIFR